MHDIENLIIRLEQPRDYRAVEVMTREAFWNLYVPGGDEHYLAHILRSSEDFLPELDFVAELEGVLIGNIMFSRSWVESDDGRRWDTVTFGPLCVLPAYHGRGVGSALVRHALEAARAQGHRAVSIHGAPNYYKRFGFDHGKAYGIANHEGKYPAANLFLPLYPDALNGVQGRAYESPTFQLLDSKAVEEFDKGFPPKKKERLPSQEDFLRIVQTYL